MNSMFYVKLAAQNLKKNKETYVPYIVSCIGTIFIYFMLLAFTYNPGLSGMPDSVSLKQLFGIGRGVVTVFAVIFIFYTNSFLMKRRKKEIGLYALLGLEKRHVARIMFFESLMIAVGTIGLSLLLGAVFGKLLFLVLTRAVAYTNESTFVITQEAVLPTLTLFLMLFALTFLWNYIQVKTSNPISLLHAGSSGEREPRARVLLVLIGILGIGFGYYEALSVESIFEALMVFFIAVISVVIGTYATFTSGSIAILKKLKKNRRFYYKPEHFISVSNLIYRMKKNAVGLGNICILSTMVLIVVSTTTSLFLGKQDMLEHRYIHDLEVTWENGKMLDGYAKKLISRKAEEFHLSIEREYDVNSAKISLFRSPKEETSFFILKREETNRMSDSEVMDSYYMLELMDLDTYNRMEKKQETLESNELMLFAQTGYYDLTTMQILDSTFHVKKELNALPYAGGKTGKQMMNSYTLIVKDERIIEDLLARAKKAIGSEEGYQNGGMERHYAVDINGSDSERRSFADSVVHELEEKAPKAEVESLDLKKDNWNSLFGGLLFLGGFLGVLFLCALIMIVYFKQVSEGYEDAGRFLVLKKVGMDARDIRGTIYTQIRIVFLIPLVTAIVHEAVAFHIVKKLLSMFELYNTRLIVGCTVSVTAVFVLLYLVIYMLTARVYNRIVVKNQ